MNIVDAVLAVVLCAFAARGYVKGLFQEVFALLGLTVGFLVALRYNGQVALLFDFWPYSSFVLHAIVFAFLFLFVYIGFNYVGLLLHRSANVLFLGGLNRLGGVLAGGAKGALFVGVLLFFVISQAWVPHAIQGPVGRAALVPPLSGFGAWVATQGSALLWPGRSGPASTTGDPRRGA